MFKLQNLENQSEIWLNAKLYLFLKWSWYLSHSFPSSTCIHLVDEVALNIVSSFSECTPLFLSHGLLLMIAWLYQGAPSQLISYCFDSFIKGVSRNSTAERDSLYVDNLLLRVCNFSLSVSIALITLNLPCTLSGNIRSKWKYALLDKTVRLTCKIARHGFSYLRVWKTDMINGLHNAGPAPCLKHSQENPTIGSMVSFFFFWRISSIVFTANRKWASLFILVG